MGDRAPSSADPAEAIRQRVRLVPGIGGRKHHLLHPFNGRFHPVDHDALEVLLQAMGPRIDVASVDYVIGFPEGGSIPAYAFARLVGRPVVLASRIPLDLPDTITFEQPQAGLGHGEAAVPGGQRPRNRAAVPPSTS